mmetsp:Transcript_21902/g.36284  ORF Transcript_21902/g.36284 Transcript_21902/m.36284 type:complete len:358 (-) Transcript_21902:131-1204(-)|eukprot:CAMPEP_0184662084 /NCGR_PEP_ID=MMETSP0308-20130426/41467_1 /TAXON_ID=38269 /ORGANISM="Gloeochaete witrockiana, Strain SAG 46.84" /LENGTH=357 /DNA_ID=CAMNT_0027103827 /DNA_START=63 /DNA_END=1136 /DNA_ORIENTATION=-
MAAACALEKNLSGEEVKACLRYRKSSPVESVDQRQQSRTKRIQTVNEADHVQECLKDSLHSQPCAFPQGRTYNFHSPSKRSTDDVGTFFVDPITACTYDPCRRQFTDYPHMMRKPLSRTHFRNSNVCARFLDGARVSRVEAVEGYSRALQENNRAFHVHTQEGTFQKFLDSSVALAQISQGPDRPGTAVDSLLMLDLSHAGTLSHTRSRTASRRTSPHSPSPCWPPSPTSNALSSTEEPYLQMEPTSPGPRYLSQTMSYKSRAPSTASDPLHCHSAYCSIRKQPTDNDQSLLKSMTTLRDPELTSSIKSSLRRTKSPPETRSFESVEVYHDLDHFDASFAQRTSKPIAAHAWYKIHL